MKEFILIINKKIAYIAMYPIYAFYIVCTVFTQQFS